LERAPNGARFFGQLWIGATTMRIRHLALRAESRPAHFGALDFMPQAISRWNLALSLS
jgi:hypothetical protein